MSNDFLKCIMSGVIPIEPTLVVTTRFPVVTALLTNPASASNTNTTSATPMSVHELSDFFTRLDTAAKNNTVANKIV